MWHCLFLAQENILEINPWTQSMFHYLKGASCKDGTQHGSAKLVGRDVGQMAVAG